MSEGKRITAPQIRMLFTPPGWEARNMYLMLSSWKEGRATASVAAGETILSPWLPEASTASISEIERLDARH